MAYIICFSSRVGNKFWEKIVKLIRFFICMVTGLLMYPITKEILDEMHPTLQALPNITSPELALWRFIPLGLLILIFVYAFYGIVREDDK